MSTVEDSEYGAARRPRRPATARRSRREPIALIGIGCRFPGRANDADSFWKLLTEGRDGMVEVPQDRWSLETFFDEDPSVPAKMHTRWGGFIDGIDLFEPQFFGISPREAVHIDPQQRLLLEVAWEALEDGGQPPDRLSGSATGVFVGISTHDYADIQLIDPKRDPDKDVLAGLYGGTGGVLSVAANRISYAFNLLGPSIAIDTACSSALVATHLACQSIWQGECSLALAGGVNCIISPTVTVAFCKAGMLSADGRCKAFDARANGYVRSEGAGMVVLKPLSMALADGNPIYALIRATGVNQDGHTPGLTVPSQRSQEELLRTTYREAGIPRRHVRYVEAHGTGTSVGDPIEGNAIGRVLGRGRTPADPLLIGSVKTNIGHMEAASGAGGLIKAALMLQRGAIPPSLNFEEPNPKLDFDRLHLRVPRALEPLSRGDGPAAIGVNSFGFGGTNAHVVLEQAPAPTPRRRGAGAVSAPRLVPLSAHSEDALKAMAAAYLDCVSASSQVSPADLAYTGGQRRAHHDQRLALVAASREELIEQLQAFTAGESRPRMVSGRVSGAQRPKVAFVFSGMGPQWWAMGRELLEHEPVFREALEACDALLSKHASWSLLAELTADEASSRMDEAEFSQPANFALQVALASLWRSYGIEPDAIVGHSAGEVAAACVAGALSLDDAVTVIYHRSRLQQRAAGTGRMLAVGLTASEAEALAGEYRGRVCLAAINGASSATLSGDEDALLEISRSLESRQVFNRLVAGNIPYHSQHMDPLKDELLACLHAITPREPSVPIFSVVSGAAVDRESFGAEYWWRNVRQPVRFADCIEKLIGTGHGIFLELSPHPVLARDIATALAARGKEGTVLASLRREEPERAQVLSTLGSLYVQGFPVDWERVHDGGGEFVRLPAYPWQRERYWHESKAAQEFRLGRAVHPLLGTRQESAHPTWQVDLDAKQLGYLEEHALLDTVLYPAAAYLEMTLAAARELFGSDSAVVESMEIKRPLVLIDRDSLQLQLVYEPEGSAVNVFSRVLGTGNAWTLNMVGRISRGADRAPSPIDLAGIIARCPDVVRGDACYAQFESRRLQYGPQFQGIVEVRDGDGESLAHVTVPEALDSDTEAYRFHPAWLDSCLQVVHRLTHREDGVYVPIRVERVKFFSQPTSTELWSHGRLVRAGDRTMEVEATVVQPDGTVAMEIKGVRCQFLPNSARGLPEDLKDCLFQVQWLPKSRRGLVRPPLDYLAPLPEALSELPAQAARLSDELGQRRIYEAFAQAERLSSAYVVAALRDLGLELTPGLEVAVDVLAGRLGILPRYEPLLDRLLDMLEEDGVLTRQAGVLTLKAAAPAIEPEALRLVLLERFPEEASLLQLLGNCGPRLAEVLRGECDPLPLIFASGSMSLSEAFYQDSPMFQFYNLIARDALRSLVQRLPEDRTLRILEVGAGTGGMTSRLLPELPPGRTEYVFTDVSGTFLASAQQKFRDYPFVQYGLLDIERSPDEQGFQPHSFDLVVAADVLHATRDLRETLANVRGLLASGGILLLLEVTGVFRPLDLIFGLLEGWWRFADHDLRPAHPLLSPPRWRRLLQEEGFDQAVAVADVEPPLQPMHTLFLARGPGLEEEALRTEAALGLPAEPGCWLVFADSSGLGYRLAAGLDAYGESCILVTPGESFALLDDTHCQVRPSEPEDIQRLLDYVRSEWPECRGAIHLWSLDIPPIDGAAIDMQATRLLGPVSVLHLVQGLARSAAAVAPRLWLVTRGAQSIAGEDAPSPFQAPLWGLGRVVMYEQPQLRCTLIDLDAGDPAADVELLLGEAWADDDEQEIAFRRRARFMNRVLRMHPAVIDAAASPVLADTATTPFHLEASRPGLIESLVLKETRRREPAAGEIEIEVHAAGLNFRDVMKAMDLYPTEDERDSLLGDECAGVVARVGKGVTGFAAGDRVIAIAPGCFSAFVTVPVAFAARLPEGLSFTEAASIPIAYFTSHYSLNHVARIRAGERVLVHAAAGGVGLAAVELCKRAGAEIFATAGSPDKRDYLRSLGIEHVMDDRSLDFADQIMATTGGEGVDVVLNSLAGEFIPRSLSLLRTGGRFLELGRVDIYRNSHLALWPFRNGLSFTAIDMAAILRERHDLAQRLLTEIMEGISDGSLRPLPTTTFPIGEAAEAFRFMSGARHTGKIVLDLQGTQAPVVAAPEGPRFKAEATYLISGGLGGLGLAVAGWMVEEGARHFVLAGRSGASTPEAQAAVSAIEQRGAEVRVLKADVTRREDVEGLLAVVERSMPPLRGVIHTAMVLDDGLLTDLNRERFARVMEPKVAGAWHLHQATRNLPLDFFVSFSSFSSLVGVPGQANYAAANAFLDTLAHHRRALGLPSLVVNWSAIGEVGYVARHTELTPYFERQGIRSLGVRETEAILGRLMEMDLPQAAVARIDVRKLAAFYAQLAPSARLDHIARIDATAISGLDARKGQRGWVRNAVLSARQEEREPIVDSFLREQLASALGISPSRLDFSEPLSSFGLDSLIAVQLETLIEVEAGVSLPTGFLLAPDVNMAAVVAQILTQLTPAGAGVPAIAAV